MKIIFSLGVLLLLSGCFASAPTIVDHNVMVTVPCKVTLPAKPQMPLTDSGDVKDDMFVKTKKALAEIELRKGYEEQLEAAAESCK